MSAGMMPAIAMSPPVDKGWAWVIVLAVFCTKILCVGYFRAFSVFFVVIIDTFQASSSLTSLIMGVQNAVCCVTALLVHNVLLEMVEVRSSAMTGGLVIALGMMLGVFANSVPFLILTLSVLVGIGNAMTYGPSIVLIGQYFQERRALANSLASMGASVGSIVLPVLATHLLIQYGLRGALLLYGAVTFHICVFASLYRPFPKSTSTKNASVSECSKAEDLDKTLLTAQDVESEGEVGNATNRDGEPDQLCFSVVSEKSLPSKYLYNADSEPLPRKCDTENVRMFSSDNQLFSGQTKSQNMEWRTCSVSDMRGRTVSRYKHLQHTRLHLSQRLENALCQSHPQLLTKTISPKRYNSIETTEPRVDEASHPIINYDDETTKEGPCRKLLEHISCEASLLRMPTFWIVQAYVCVGAMGTTGGGSYMGVLMQEKGLTKQDTAVALSVWGACNLLGRLLSGLLADRKVLLPVHISAIAFLGIGTLFMSVSFLPLTTVAWTFFSGLYGLLEGVYFSMLPEIVISMVTQTYFSRTFGFVQLSQSMFATMLYPVLGGVKDVTGSYNATFYVLGGCAFMAAFLLFLRPILRTFRLNRLLGKL